MSNIATSTTYSDQQLSEALAERFLLEPQAKRVVIGLVNTYSIAGRPTKSLKLNRWDDPGLASAATEGTAFTSLTQFDTTAQSLTPTEGAVMMSLITNDAVETRVPGMTGVAEVMNDGSLQQKIAALAPEAGLIMRAIEKKIESDLTALFAGLSRSSSPASGSDLALSHFDAGLLKLEGGEDLPHEDIVASLDSEQLGNIRTELMVTSGGVSGNLWSRDIASIVELRPDVARNGLKGVLLGVPVYQHSKAARQTANGGDDVVGAIFLRGTGDPELSGSGQPGCFAYVEGRAPVFTVEGDHRERGGEIQGNGKYAVGERVDLWGVKFVSDAPA